MNVTSETLGLSVDIYEIFYNVNEASNGWFVGLLLISIYFLVLSLTMNKMTFVKANIYSAFASFILSLMFWALNMITWVYAGLFLVLLLAYIFSVFTTGDV